MQVDASRTNCSCKIKRWQKYVLHLPQAISQSCCIQHGQHQPVLKLTFGEAKQAFAWLIESFKWKLPAAAGNAVSVDCLSDCVQPFV